MRQYNPPTVYVDKMNAIYVELETTYNIILTRKERKWLFEKFDIYNESKNITPREMRSKTLRWLINQGVIEVSGYNILLDPIYKYTKDIISAKKRIRITLKDVNKMMSDVNKGLKELDLI